MPKPPKRLNNTDKFSTFLVDNRQGDNRFLWKTEANLRRNLVLYQKYNPLFAELFIEPDRESEISQFWLNLALNDTPTAQDWEPPNRKFMALKHLAAYLDESCYWSVKEVCGNYSRPWEDYFAIARDSFHNPVRFTNILQNYNPDRGANLVTYINRALTNIIKDEAQVKKFSPWRLLAQKTDQKLTEALKANGEKEPYISLVLVARNFFKKVYHTKRTQNPNFVPGKRWLEPTPEDFDEVANIYNQYRLLPAAPHAVSVNGITVTGATIKNWMETCITALQNQLKSIPEDSLESLIDAQRESEFKQLYSSDPSGYQDLSLSEQLEEKESLIVKEVKDNSNQERQKINAIFEEQIRSIQAKVEKEIQRGKLRTLHKKIPLLRYGLGFKQQPIACILGINQSNIYHHISGYYEQPLIKALAGIYAETQWVETYVSQWLIKDFAAPLNSDYIQAALVENFGKFPSEYREVLQLRFGYKLTEQQISQRLSLTELAVQERIRNAQTCLEAELIKNLETWRKDLVESWLGKFYQSQVYAVLEAAIANFPHDLQNLVKYRYRLEFTDAQTANQLQCDENQVSEGIYLVKIQLQNALVKWLQANLDIVLERSAEFSRISQVVEAWLNNLYK